MSEKQGRWLDDYCHYCGGQLNSWDVKVSKALGYLKYHCCERCIAKEYDQTVDALRDLMEEYFGMRPCTRPLGTGVYRIITLTHTGDTRGNDWYTEFTGIAQPGFMPQTGKSFV